MYLYSFISNKCVLYTNLRTTEHFVKKCIEMYMNIKDFFFNNH